MSRTKHRQYLYGADHAAMVATFYRFVPLHDFRALRDPLFQRCADLGLLGTILLADEGINGTVAGPERSVGRLLDRLRCDERFAGLNSHVTWAPEQPFYRMKVRLKKVIVSFGVAGVNPLSSAGEYVSPNDWNDLITRHDVRLIDVRNHYEVHLGTFEGAEDPHTGSFRDFPSWADENLDPERDQHVAMFCTGGIRCEKSTAYLRQRGFRNVYHLKGGILHYLESIDPVDSLWRGDCFVFDNRVSVDHGLQVGDHEICPACRMPLTKQDRSSPKFELHVSCPRCFDRLTPQKRAGLLERARQTELAKLRGEHHLGNR